MLKDKRKSAMPVPAHSRAVSRKTAETEETSLLGSALKGSLWGFFAFAFCGILLITAVTAIAYANPDPGPLIAPLSLLSLMPSMFLGGFVTAKRVKEAPLLCGIVSGCLITLLSMLLGIIMRGMPSSGYEFWQSAVLHTAAVGFSVLGAFAGNIKKRQKRGTRRFG